MSDYYTRKRFCYEKINSMLAGQDNVKKSSIYITIMHEFGFGKKTVDEYLEQLKAQGKILIIGDEIENVE